jgi:cysteinyl-tRNA synthetase, unknown class
MVHKMSRHYFGGLIALAIATAFAVSWPYRGNWARSSANHTMVRPLVDAKTWRYQLDRIDVGELAADPSDLLVIDYAKAEGKQPLTAKDVARLKTRSDGRPRLVVAYLSVGESEEYRYYWNAAWAQSPPDWLGEENCAWPKAHRVRFWTDGWKTINYRAQDSYLRRIIAAGFDGVYLDRVDIYETFEKERPAARQEMIAHVAELAAAGRRIKPGFLVIPQNAEALLDDPYYRMVIDGLGKESLLHGGSETAKRNLDADIKWSYGLLRRLLDDGKPVFVVEYLLNAAHIDNAATELRRRGIVPAFETRALDGKDPTLPVDLKVEVGTPERTTKQCPPGTSW